MITIIENKTIVPGKSVVIMRGLSTDIKPTNTANCSRFYEMDTDKTYGYDADAVEWVEIPKSDTPGPTPESSIINYVFNTKVEFTNTSVVSNYFAGTLRLSKFEVSELLPKYPTFALIAKDKKPNTIAFLTPTNLGYYDTHGTLVIAASTASNCYLELLANKFLQVSFTNRIYFASGVTFDVGDYEIYFAQNQ